MNTLFIDIAVYDHPLLPHHRSIHRLRRIASDEITERITNVPLPGGKIAISRGLLLLASATKLQGGNVEYLHYSHETPESLQAAFRRADVLCLYSMTPTAPICLQLAESAKTVKKNVCVAIGGPHAASQAKELLETGVVDFVCFGDTRPSLLATAMLDLASWRDCPGIAFRDERGNTHVNPVSRDGEMDGEEYVDYEVLPRPLDQYYFNLSASQGCAYSCSFCSDGTRTLRLRPIEDLMAEVRLLDDNLPPGSWIHFFDTIFTVPANRASEICGRLARETHKLTFSCDIKANHLTPELAKSLNDARFRFVSMGFETSDDETLSISNKQNTFAECCRTAEMLRLSSPECAIKGYWLLGLPGSSPAKTNHDLQQIERLLDQEIVDIVGPKCFVPYPETPFFQHPERFGLNIWTRDWSLYDRFQLPPVSSPATFTRKELSDFLIKAETTVLAKYCARLGFRESDLEKLNRVPKRYNGELYSRLIS